MCIRAGVADTNVAVGQRRVLCRVRVKSLCAKYSALPKFGFVVCVVHPGLTLRGDHVSSRFASRALQWTRQRRAREAGRIALREPEASCRRAALSGSSRQHSSGNVDNVGR
jgi:hypothetical protein